MTRKTRKNQKKQGGGLFSGLGLNAPVFENKNAVSLSYNSNPIKCDVCGNIDFTEIQSSIDKSKVRTFVREAVFGDGSENIDNTSVILYVCQTCGNCRMVRNNGQQKITATLKPVQQPTTTTTA
jgi:hypothetical protein